MLKLKTKIEINSVHKGVNIIQNYLVGKPAEAQN